MRTRRHVAPTPPPQVEDRRDEQPRPGCDGHLDLIDAVWTGSRWGRRALPILTALCDDCPVQVDCWADPEWRDALKGAR